ncbi:hypothetical protein AB1K54_06240 [Microbacterium sp. BWT-B31]|uniref:hypothetical protein n=1 Tax=Microbacterium sp. BWT-B31 TaxID=3232072 RepID=UPI003528F751
MLDNMAAERRSRYDDPEPSTPRRNARGALATDDMVSSRTGRLDDYEPSFADPDDPAPALVVVELTASGTRWDNAHATSRRRDPAARWLAAHHPDELADFPAAL